MRVVQFDHVKAQAHRASGRVDECRLHRVHAGAVERFRGLPLGDERNRRGRYRLPATLGRRHVATAVGGLYLRTLAPGVRELDADRHVAVTPHRRHDTRQRGLALVRIQAQALAADAPARLDRARLDDQKPGARHGQVAQVDQVPVGGTALYRAVLAHGRNHDAVGQRERAQREGLEQCAGQIDVSASACRCALVRLHAGGAQ